ncbi:MAG: hypothetical protein C5B60_03915 [Chloroflexi bacterium]|nr:MAG: hypothetical protein C5B60_03915 [Chloroflexota bacterium]
MPDEKTTETTAQPAEPTPSIEQLQAQLKEANDIATTAKSDADQAKRYLVDLVARMGQNEADSRANQPVQTDATPEELIQEFKDNPVGLLDRHFAARMGPILHDHLETQAKMIRQAFIRDNKEAWDEFGGEVDAFMTPMSMSTKAKPESWIEGLNYIRGKHVDQLVEKGMKKKEEDEKRSLLEGRGSSAGGGLNGKGRYRLSDDQKSAAKGFGMTEEDWVKNMLPSEKGETEEPF